MSDPKTPDSLWLRLLWLVIIVAMMSVAQTLLSLLTFVQLIIMATNKRQPNAEIAAFGKRLGLWLAQAAQFQTAATEDKPWPWAPLS
jgi:hypothetical protein